MDNIKVGDIVGRISYNKDVLFEVKKIIKNENQTIVLLRGVIERIEADSSIEDLEKVGKEEEQKKLKEVEERINKRIVANTRGIEKVRKGKILHLDGDRRYSEKSYNFYKKLGLNVVVKNIPEYKQPIMVKDLLIIYRPDILIVTRS